MRKYFVKTSFLYYRKRFTNLDVGRPKLQASSVGVT